ncbi:MAG: ornithine cyclodeaminase family protein [Anaerolineae bacterium]
MTLILGEETLADVLDMAEAIDLVEEAYTHEAAGRTLIAPRQTTKLEGGWMRLMFAADYATGYAATKAFHLARGVGVRYLVLLYRLEDGELLAILDGRLITDLRTGATSGVAARRLAPPVASSVGILGSGHQARTQLEALAVVLPLVSASVFSLTREHRRAFADEMSEKLGLAVEPVDSAAAAVRGQPVVVLATNATGPEPVLRASWLADSALICAVGSTRAEAIEVDEATFERAKLVVVDTLNAATEAGDLQRALESGRISPDGLLSLAQLVGRPPEPFAGGHAVFKSVGTALQDLALAARYYERLGPGSQGLAAPGLASLKQPVSYATPLEETSS